MTRIKAINYFNIVRTFPLISLGTLAIRVHKSGLSKGRVAVKELLSREQNEIKRLDKGT